MSILSLIALLSTPAVAVDYAFGAFTGTQILSPKHELYSQDLPHRGLRPSIGFGARLGIYPIHLLGFEADGFVMPTAVAASGGGALVYTGALSAVVGPGVGNPRQRFHPFGSLGMSSMGVRSSALGRDADAALHWGVGARYAIRDRFRVRADLRNQWGSAFGTATFPATHVAVYLGVEWKLGPWPPPSVKDQVVELLNAYEDPVSAEDLAKFGGKAEEALMQIAKDPKLPPSRRGRAITGLALLPPQPEVSEFLVEVFEDPDMPPVVRRKSVRTLAETYPETAEPVIDRALESDDLQMEWAIIHYLEREADVSVEADDKIEEDVPHVTFVMLDPEGNPIEDARIAVTDRFGVTEEFERERPRYIDPRYTGEEEWEVKAEAGPCLVAEKKGTTGEAAAKFTVQMVPQRTEQLALEITDENGKPIPATVRFEGGEPYCAPKDPVSLDPTPGDAVQPIGPGEYEVIIEAEGYLPRRETVVVKPGEPVRLKAELPATELTVEKDKISTEDIFFDSGTANLAASAGPILDELARVLIDFELNPLRIEGHTDNVGDPARNLELSQQRADAVKAYLVRKGVPDAWLKPKGFGDARPIDTNDTPAGRAKNRRVEFVIGDETPEEGE